MTHGDFGPLFFRFFLHRGRNKNKPYNDKKGEIFMLKRQLAKNIEDLDLKISKLSLALEQLEVTDENYDELYESIMGKMDKLTELRCKLAESKVNGSLAPVLISSAVGIGSLVLVLHYEEKEIITSKAISMLPGLFRGSK